MGRAGSPRLTAASSSRARLAGSSAALGLGRSRPVAAGADRRTARPRRPLDERIGLQRRREAVRVRDPTPARLPVPWLCLRRKPERALLSIIA